MKKQGHFEGFADYDDYKKRNNKVKKTGESEERFNSFKGNLSEEDRKRFNHIFGN